MRIAHVTLALTLGLATIAAAPPDPLAKEIARLGELLREESKDEFWGMVKQGADVGVARAATALRDGRRHLALHRFAAAHVNIAAGVYTKSQAQRTDAVLDAEWARVGKTIASTKAAATMFESLAPAATRAQAEAALPQIRVFHDASREYGRSTVADNGFYYLGSAIAQREFIEFLKRVSEPTSKKAPRLRSIAPELDALERELLAMYKPPLSIDKHPEFIGANSARKEAIELDAAGLRYGAMLRYLQGVLRTATIRPDLPKLDSAAVTKALQGFEQRIDGAEVDHTIARLFLEIGEAELADAAAGTVPPSAIAVVTDVLPKYFAALESAPARKARPKPSVTVTLVRWPYT